MGETAPIGRSMESGDHLNRYNGLGRAWRGQTPHPPTGCLDAEAGRWQSKFALRASPCKGLHSMDMLLPGQAVSIAGQADLDRQARSV